MAKSHIPGRGTVIFVPSVSSKGFALPAHYIVWFILWVYFRITGHACGVLFIHGLRDDQAEVLDR